MRSKAQIGALVFGGVFVMVGILGFLIPGGTGMVADPELAPLLLGLFPVNLLHNLVHLTFGIWGIAASRSTDGSITYGRVGAGIYGFLVVLAFFTPSMFGLVPIGGNDIWLHAILAIGLAWVGWGATRTATA